MGFPNTAILGPGPTTYFDITGGLNISPELPQGTPWLKSITFRPKVRYDASLNGTTPFNGQSRPWRPGLPWFRGRHQELAIHLWRRHHREILEHVLKKVARLFRY